MASATTTAKTNKSTVLAGLTFNVNTVKNRMKEYFDSQGSTPPMFSGGHVALTALLEKLYELILKECVKRVGKEKSGVRQVNREALQFCMLLHTGFKNYYSLHLEKYDKDTVYSTALPVEAKHMDTVMKRVDKDLSLTSKAKNLVCYLLERVFIDITSTATQFLSFSGRKSLDAKCVMYCVRNRFSDSISHELNTEIGRAMKALGDEVDDNEDTKEDHVKEVENKQPDDVDEGDDEPQTKSKGAKNDKSDKSDKSDESKPAKKTAPKKNDSKSKQIEESNDDDEQDEDNEDNEDNEEDEEEVVETKPKKTATNNNKKETTTKPKPKGK